MSELLKVLVGGSSSAYADAFFTRVEDVECLSTSPRPKDVENHIKYFRPDVFIIPLKGIPKDQVPKFAPLKEILAEHNVPIAIYGSRDELNMFEDLAGYRPELTIEFPQLMSNIVRIVNSLVNPGGKDTLSSLKGFGDPPMPLHKRYHILVIDDDAMMLRSIRRILEDDYNVATATSGRLAYKFLSENQTDLILLDYNMPEEMGDQVFKTLRSRNSTLHVPIIFLTGTSEVSVVKKLLLMKPNGYLMKPVDPKALTELIEGILNS